MVRSRVLNQHLVEELAICNSALGNISLRSCLLLSLVNKFGEEAADTLNEARRIWGFEQVHASVDKSVNHIRSTQSHDILLNMCVHEYEEAASLIINSFNLTVQSNTPYKLEF